MVDVDAGQAIAGCLAPLVRDLADDAKRCLSPLVSECSA
jgi:hypothetical protein